MAEYMDEWKYKEIMHEVLWLLDGNGLALVNMACYINVGHHYHFISYVCWQEINQQSDDSLNKKFDE